MFLKIHSVWMVSKNRQRHRNISSFSGNILQVFVIDRIHWSFFPLSFPSITPWPFLSGLFLPCFGLPPHFPSATPSFVYLYNQFVSFRWKMKWNHTAVTWIVFSWVDFWELWMKRAHFQLPALLLHAENLKLLCCMLLSFNLLLNFYMFIFSNGWKC